MSLARVLACLALVIIGFVIIELTLTGYEEYNMITNPVLRTLMGIGLFLGCGLGVPFTLLNVLCLGESIIEVLKGRKGLVGSTTSN